MSDIATQPRSVSQTQQWEECGERFRLQRIERVTALPAAWSHHGTAFHHAAEQVERSNRAMGADEAVEAFSERYGLLVNAALDKEPNTDRWLSASGSGGDDIERRYVLGQEQTRHYVEWVNETQPEVWTTPDDQPALELYFMVELGGVKVRGYIDQLIAEDEASVRVRDLKTGTMKSKFQLETYKVAVTQKYGVTVNRGDWYLAKNGGLSRAVKLDEVTEEQVGERFAAMDAGVKRGDFEPNPGFSCRFCDMKHACSFSTSKT
ncbi:RecB family exonuclease [Streptomyces sp. H39-S7]|uniref:RecB family exonuclease n=1 Tax=Streptomyces sp. H39-S7 TaxID=3004357 RepID=UPI0022AFBF1B|nr:PD-(D/E)XK nuclease family protein [Streptomyces sp. H39-S7]MCZ4119024.1 PD-(D/E)XK nuclease family protein [Streptomyces sp. H39-S7]